MTIKDFVKEYPEFINKTLPTHKQAGKVFRQAIQHSRRCEKLDLLDVVRPNEDELIKDYQNANRRMITKKNFDSFVNLTTRIFHETGVELRGESEILSNYLATKPFIGLESQRIGLDSFIDNCVFPYSLEDPNGLLVTFPYNPLAPNIPPARPFSEGGQDPTKEIAIKFLIVPFDKRVKTPPNTIGFIGGSVPLERNGRANDYDFYYLADTSFFYRYMPVSIDKQGHVVYELEDWYFHNIGTETERMLPAIPLPGKLTKCEDNYNTYHESFLHGAYENWDEGLSSFIDNQGVRVQHNYPKVLMSKLQCPGGCIKGKIKQKGLDEEGKKLPHLDCQSCGGTGYITNPGVFGVLIKPDNSGIDEKGDANPYQYITPDVAAINNSYDVGFDMIDKGNKAIGLDILEAINESGVAKDMRLEPIQDILRPIGKALLGFKERLGFLIECLLVKEPKSRMKPVIQIPNDYKVKDLKTLKEEAETALPADRIDAEIALYSKKYRGDKKKIWAKQMALHYSPLLSMTMVDVIASVNSGAYFNTDIIKRNKAVEAFEIIARDNEEYFLMEFDTAFELADKYIKRYLPEPIIGLVGDSGGG